MKKIFEGCLRILLNSNNISLGSVNEIIEKLEKTGCRWRDLGDIEANAVITVGLGEIAV